MQNTVISLKTRDIRPFEPTVDINPKFYRLQRVTATTSFNRASFRADRPEPNMMLYGYAPIQWQYSVQRRDDNADAVLPFPAANQDVIYQKPFSMTNSMKNISVSVNGYGFNYENINIWGKYLHQVFSNRKHMEKKFSVAGGPFPTYQGAYNENFTLGIASDREDEGIKQATNLAFAHYAPALGAVNGVFTVSALEPLMVGLFNPYEEKHTLPKWCWYKQNSWMIPHVTQLGIEVEFTELALNSFVYAYGRKAAGGNEIVLTSTPAIQNLQGEMLLTWISPDVGYVIPPNVSLNSWNFRHFQFSVNNGVALDLLETALFDTGIMQLQQVPTSLLVFATNDKDGKCFALSQDTDGVGTGQTTHFGDGPLEMNLSIDDITISIEVNNKVIDTRFTQQQMYRITEQNCNYMPYMFNSWVGGVQQYASTPGNMFLYLRPQDLNISTSTGKLVTNFTFQMNGTVSGRPGFSFDRTTFLGGGQSRAAPEIYNLHVVAFFNNYSVHLKKDGLVTANYKVHAI